MHTNIVRFVAAQLTYTGFQPVCQGIPPIVVNIAGEQVIHIIVARILFLKAIMIKLAQLWAGLCGIRDLENTIVYILFLDFTNIGAIFSRVGFQHTVAHHIVEFAEYTHVFRNTIEIVEAANFRIVLTDDFNIRTVEKLVSVHGPPEIAALVFIPSHLHYLEFVQLVFPFFMGHIKKYLTVPNPPDSNMSLTIQERIKDLRVERRLTLKELAEQTGLSSSALGSYEADDTKDISHYALTKLVKFYGVTADYLLGLSEMKSHPNADLADLHLSDSMIALLKSGRIDNALLCELAAHPDFVKLLADIQIYVEGIAAMQIQSLNTWVDVARAEIVEKYQPGENDRTAYLLQAAHVNEVEYFTSRVHRDIDTTMEDMREAHRGRSDSAPESSAAEELKHDLEEVAQFNGSKLEQLIMLFCKQTKLRYNKLTEEEKQWLARIAQKSELLKSSIPLRGK